MKNAAYALSTHLVQFLLWAGGLVLPGPATGQLVRKHWIAVADSKLYVEESGEGHALLLLHGVWLTTGCGKNRSANWVNRSGS